MRNPLNKRYKRELIHDFGKYAAIFLFLTAFTACMSGFFVTNNSVTQMMNNSATVYNQEDGHITFNKKVSQSVLKEIEDDNQLKFYQLFYKEETVKENKTKLRIYKNRTSIDLVSVMEGKLPAKANQIAIDRMYASNNNLKVGDKITFDDKQYTITALISLVDYQCLFEDNADMMFDAVNFGVAIVSNKGFDAIGNAHLSYNYGYQYNDKIKDDTDANERSEDLIDSLEDILKEHDEVIVQDYVDNLYEQADQISKTLENDFTKQSKVIETKVTEAYKDANTKAIESLTEDEILDTISASSGISKQTLIMNTLTSLGVSYNDISSIDSTTLFNAIISSNQLDQTVVYKALYNAGLKKINTIEDALIASYLGTTEAKYKAMVDALDDVSDLKNKLNNSTSESKKIDFDDLESAKDYENDLSFDVIDDIREIVDKIEATGICDVTQINKDLDDIEALTQSKISDNLLLTVKDYNPEYTNKAMRFVKEDGSSDKVSGVIMFDIVIVIIAFIFAVTASNTIISEANVIGTLRATGYTRFELLKHYITLPVIITVISALIGNVFAYTVMENVFKAVYYSNYSLPVYQTCFSLEAFILTTVVPIVLMLVINAFVLWTKLKIRPLQFLRGEFKNKQRKHVLKLSKKIKFFSRFRIRILLQNIPSYITLYIGIFLSGVLLVFGLMFGPLLNDYGKLVEQQMFAKYQYVVIDNNETEDQDVEKYCMTSLETTYKGYKADDVSIYGIEDHSNFIKLKSSKGNVSISSAYSKKYNIKVGDQITLKESYSNKTYTFKVGNIYNYDVSVSVFMNYDDYLDVFNEDQDYFTGYLSNHKIKDLDDDEVATIITKKELTKVVTQMQVSMGSFMSVFKGLGIVMFLLIMYILTKQIIDRNIKNIFITKILGYTDVEIGKLYLVITSFVVMASLILSVPLIDIGLRLIFDEVMYKEISGYIPYIISNTCYIKMFLLGMISYLVIAVFMLQKIKKIPKNEILKNQIV